MVKKKPDAPAVTHIQLNVYNGLDKGTPERFVYMMPMITR